MTTSTLGALPLVLALGSALCYGAADFAGGLAARRASGLAAAAGAQGTGLILVAVLALLGPPRYPSQADLLWGAFSGLCGGTGLMLFFGALAAGRMSTVAPIAAVISAAIPVAAGLALGERPSPTALAGILVAGLAIVLVSREDAHLHGVDGLAAEPEAPRTPVRVLLMSALAGVLFGGFFTALAQTQESAGFWPLLVNRALSSTLLWGLLLFGPATRRIGMPTREYRQGAVTSGVLDVGASLLFLWATARGPLSLVAPLGALYPVSTVVLAVLVLRERIGRAQRVGLALAGAALLLIGA